MRCAVPQSSLVVQEKSPSSITLETDIIEHGKSSIQVETGIAHDIFLSHSGAQKGFAKGLYKELSRFFSTFFDITHHSLPPGEPFPARIFQAAKSCGLALVILSEEFVCSKWPMVELSTFVDALSSGLKLLPLFFKLSLADLKNEVNLKRWRKLWKTHARLDGKDRIDVLKWDHALKTLCSQNGIIFEQAAGEQDYIDKIMLAVSEIVPPVIKFGTTYISGKDRLCKVILDKFEEMELHHKLSSIASSSTGTQPKVSVLGLYGLPGSGKSTLCKCLLDHFLPFYGGTKTLYLEFLSTSSYADIVEKLKELLHLTGFRNRVSLDRATDLEHVEHVLKTCHLSSCRVFLVVDNISDKSWEAVHRILRLGVGQGSKIILVAHTLDVLRPILCSLKCGLGWASDSIAVPSINDMEAIEILLQTVMGRPVAFDKHLTFREMEIVKRIVRMCSSCGLQRGPVQLPLVIKALGVRLLKYDGGSLEEWESDVESFWTRVMTYKQSSVVEELLGENFKGLPNQHLQILFLDVALFILHIDKRIEAVIDSLSMMHGFTTSRIRMMMKDLERHCFLTVSEIGIISVHGVYLEFAKSLQDDPSKHLSTTISWCWKYHEVTDAEVGSKLIMEEGQHGKLKGSLRALILEVGEGYARVHLQGFSGLKAVGLRNCKSLAVLGIAGLSSLVVLEIRNCAVFRRLECDDSDYASLLSMKRLCIINESYKPEEKCKVQALEQVSYLRSIVSVLTRVTASSFRQPKSLEVGLIASHMRNLQVLHLKNTGISRLEHVGSSWPQLRALTIVEQNLERLELGYLPKLTEFVFCDFDKNGAVYRMGKVEEAYIVRVAYVSEYSWRRKKGNPRYLPVKDLLLACPRLEQVMMRSAFFKQGQLGSLPAGLVSFQLHFFFTAAELPDLSLSAHTLQELEVACCEKLERVNLDLGFTSLRTLILWNCENLVSVCGLGSLPNLRFLHVVHCSKLQSLIGFDHLEMLELLFLIGCKELKEISCFNALMNLRLLLIRLCPNLCCQLANIHLRDLEELRDCEIQVYGQRCLNLRNCKNLEQLCLTLMCVSGTDLSETIKLEDLDSLNNLEVFTLIGERVDEITKLRLGLGDAGSRLSSLDLEVVPVYGHFASRASLTLNSFGALIGVEHLLTLKSICLRGLSNLRSLWGLESLIQLRRLDVHDCPVLEELPSLHTLVHMVQLLLRNCEKLKAVEGCDYMKQLQCACFEECKSMERFPLNNLTALNNVGGFSVSFWGCKFASNVELMAAWAVEAAAPQALRVASVSALLWEYYLSYDAIAVNRKERVAEAMLHCLDIPQIEEWILESPIKAEWKVLLGAAMRDLEQREKVLNFIYFLDDPSVSRFLRFKYLFTIRTSL